MTPILQRKNECSLAALCVLNGLSQVDYEALSDLVSERFGLLGYIKVSAACIAYGIKLVRDLGLTVPSDYGVWTLEPAGDDPDLQGKGIVYVSFLAPRKRTVRNAHVITFSDGKLIDSNGKAFKNWGAYVAHLEGKGWRNVTADKIFRG